MQCVYPTFPLYAVKNIQVSWPLPLDAKLEEVIIIFSLWDNTTLSTTILPCQHAGGLCLTFFLYGNGSLPNIAKDLLESVAIIKYWAFVMTMSHDFSLLWSNILCSVFSTPYVMGHHRHSENCTHRASLMPIPMSWRIFCFDHYHPSLLHGHQWAMTSDRGADRGITI